MSKDTTSPTTPDTATPEPDISAYENGEEQWGSKAGAIIDGNWTGDQPDDSPFESGIKTFTPEETHDWFTEVITSEHTPSSPRVYPQHAEIGLRAAKQSATYQQWLVGNHPLRLEWAKQGENYRVPDEGPMYYLSGSYEMADIADRIQNGDAHWEDLYRAYKHTPHQPASVLLKYLVHRYNNMDAYDDPIKATELDAQFMKLHQYGGAAEKNGHLTPEHLHKMVQRNPSLLPALVEHRNRVQQMILRGVGMNVRLIGGEPHVALTRGLNSDIMSHEHALSSTSDDPGIGFGNVKHHMWVPLKDVWYSFDMGPRYPSGNHGPETEYLISHTGPRYEANPKGEDTKRSRFRDWNDERRGIFADLSGDNSEFSVGERVIKAVARTKYDDATDDDVAHALQEYLTAAETERGGYSDYHWRGLLDHHAAGPKTLDTLTNYMRKHWSDDNFSDHHSWRLLATKAVPAGTVMQAAKADARSVQYSASNPNLSAEQLSELINTPAVHPGHMANALLSDRKPPPSLTSNHIREVYNRLKVINNLGPMAGELIEHALTPKDVLLDIFQSGKTTRLDNWRIVTATEHNPAMRDPEVGDAVVKYCANIMKDVPSGINITDDLARKVAEYVREYADKDDGFSIPDFRPWNDVLGMRPDDAPRMAANYVRQRGANEDIASELLRNELVLAKVVENVSHSDDALPSPRLQVAILHGVHDAKGAFLPFNKEHIYEKFAQKKGLGLEAVEYLLHIQQEAAASRDVVRSLGLDLPTTLGHNKDPNVRHILEELAKKHAGVEVPKPVYDAENQAAIWPPDVYEKLTTQPQGPVKHAVQALLNHHGYAARVAHEHVIKPFPAELAKAEGDPMYAARMYEWLSGVKRHHAKTQFHYPTHYRDAMQILNRGTLHPKPTPHLLHGYAVFAHPASDDPYHIQRRLDSAHREDDHPVILHFETDEEPEGMHDGQHYWTREIPIRNAHLAHQGHNPLAKSELAKMAISDIAPGKLLGEKDGGKDYDYTHLLPPMNELKGLSITVRTEPSALSLAGLTKVSKVSALLHHNGKKVGEVGGRIKHVGDSPTLHVDWADLANTKDVKGVPLYHGKRLGEKLYEALMAHSKHIMGATHVGGSNHSSRAHAAWLRLAAKHGLSYRAEKVRDPDDIAGPEDLPGAFDGQYGKYSFKLNEMGAIKKSLNLQGKNALESWELETAAMMLGHHPHAARALKAAHWLSGRKHVANDDVYQMALRVHDGDHERAALHAYGLTDSEKNLKALRAMMENPEFQKSEDVPPSLHNVQAAFPEGEETAQEVVRAVEADATQMLKLSGKHSKGSMAAKDPKTGNVWLLKPGSGKVSPAAGVDECGASQSRREACFWQVANEFQMGGYYPHCDLLMVNHKEWAVMRLLASTFDNLDKKARKDPEYTLKVLEPYRKNGTIHRWAVLDWVLGNADRHGQNLMVDKQGNLALIDHGSAFAGDGFNPAFDSKSFIPFYLRAWGPKDFFELDPDDRMRFMPEVDHEVDEELKAWLETMTPHRLGSLLVRYGIDPGPALRRLDMLKPPSPHPLCVRINALWAGYELGEDD